MTDRFAGFLVVLEEDIREDDAQATIAAIKQIKGVLDVKPLVGGWEVGVARSRLRQELLSQIFHTIQSLTEDD